MYRIGPTSWHNSNDDFSSIENNDYVKHPKGKYALGMLGKR